MRNRARSLGGEFQVASSPRGTTVRLRIPIGGWSLPCWKRRQKWAASLRNRARTARAVPPGRESVPSRGWSFEGDHVLNRRVARLKGFSYLRIVPISRGANSSHGSLSEGWSVAYHSTPQMREINRASLASVQYADIADIAKMLNLQGGGSLMDGVNEAQKLVDLPDATGKRRL